MDTTNLHTPPRPEPADSETYRRPGVPMSAGASTLLVPPLPQQQGEPSSGVGVEVGKVTPIFGTAIPLRGLSGVIRRAAYRIPEHHPGRWLALLFGDRVDVLEHRARRHPFATAAIALGLIAWWRR